MNDHHMPPIGTPGSSQATVPFPPIKPAWSVRPVYQYHAATSLPSHSPITTAEGLAVGSAVMLILALVAVWWLSRRID